MENKHLRVALAGNPNCGKTTLFNSLTGSTAYVGNWPGVTVEKRSGTFYFKGDKKKKEGVEIVDLPGIYSLSPYTPEEVISRDYILKEKPDVIINVIDGTNLERNLYLTTQILEMDVPVIAAINMVDALKENGVSIDYKALRDLLGVPVCPISALRNSGLEDLMIEAKRAGEASRQGITLLKDPAIEKAKAIYEEAKIPHSLFHAIKALEKDEHEAEENKDCFQKVQDLPETKEKDYEADIADLRYQALTPACEKIVSGKEKKEKDKLSKSDKIDRILTHRVLGPLIMVAFLFLVFHFTFAGDLFYMNAMGLKLDTYPGFISFTIAGEEVHPFEGLFYDDAGIASVGEFLHRLAGDQESGILGCIALGFKQLMYVCNAPDWVVGFFYDGVLTGVMAVLGFVPQIMLLFAFFAFMEDSGYMARVAFMLDRLFRRFGVSGRAFIPMIMGFGCGVPAIINTRTLASDKERVKTIRVIPFFTCGAKAEFLAVIAAAVAASAGFDAGLFTFLLYLLGVVIAIFSVIVMNKTTQREKVPPFIMELPAYHAPQFRALSLHVWDKGKHFIQKAFTIILASTIVVWFLANFSWNWQMVEADGQGSILQSLGMLIQPLFTPRGFGVQAGANGWTLAVASLEGIVAKENVTSVVASLAEILGQDGFEGLVASMGITPAALAAFAVFNMLTIPCFASVAAAKGELGKGKAYVGTILFWFVLSYAMGCLTYVTLQYVWTLAITLPVLAGGFVGLYFYDKAKKKKEAAAA